MNCENAIMNCENAIMNRENAIHSFFIRNQFIRNEISGGKNFKKLESWILGNLRNFSFRKQKNTKIFLIFGMKITKYEPKLRNF